MKSFKALVKREFWEHKGAIFYTPAIMAAVFAGLLILGTLTGDYVSVNDHHGMSVLDHLPQAMDELEKVEEKKLSNWVQIGLYSELLLFGFVMLLISLFYCLGSLYDERKDRSILFWKSLPISDTATVLSKFVAVCIMIPISYFVVVSVFQLFSLLFATICAWFGGNTGLILWSSSNLFSVYFNGFFSVIVASLWLAPFWSWLMFASSWAKKVAFLWGGLPILMIAVAEAWILHSSRFIEMVGERIFGGFIILNSNLNGLVGGDMFDGNVPKWYEVFSNSEFWIGLVVASLFLAGAVITQRFRDES